MSDSEKKDPWSVYAELAAATLQDSDEDSDPQEPTPLEFINPRQPRSIEDLTPEEMAQLRKAGLAYDGQDLPAATRLSTEGRHQEASFAGHIEIWDITRDGEVAYRAWVYRVDSGSIFVGNTMDVTAEFIQFHLDMCSDRTLKRELGAALRQARRRLADSKYMLRNLS